MSHYILHIPVNAADVKIFREEFEEYMERAQVITVRIASPHGGEPSEELEDAMTRVILHVLMAITSDGFQGLH